ncbi:hypothetical protein LDENG_00171950 [Lucifuga dentata]|nr:hypothetical protein LDENG_00171950 [Lucifuga dentata]
MYAPVWNNPDFQINKSTLYFSTWEQKGITHLLHLFQDKFMSFKNMIQKFGITGGNFLHYHQVKHVMKKKFQTRQCPPQLPTFVKEITNLSPMKKTLSKIYKLISCIDTSIYLPSSKWEKRFPSHIQP